MVYITELDVRQYMMDRTAADHLVLPDVAFTSVEIAQAMKTAARKYNSIQPYVDLITPGDPLPAYDNMFFDGIAASLLELKLINASMNDMDYSAGSVTASVQGKLIERLTPLIKLYSDRFTQQASARKLSINLSHAFGQVG